MKSPHWIQLASLCPAGPAPARAAPAPAPATAPAAGTDRPRRGQVGLVREVVAIHQLEYGMLWLLLINLNYLQIITLINSEHKYTDLKVVIVDFCTFPVSYSTL
jgi:hypothetical protein